MNTVERFREFLKEHGVTKFDHITLSANQFEKEYYVQNDFMGTGLRYPKSEVDKEEFAESEFRIHGVWEAML